MKKMFDAVTAAPSNSVDFSFDEAIKTFSLIVRGPAAVAATAEIWWSPTHDRSEAVKIHSLTANGNLKALDFSTSQICGGMWWAKLLSKTGDSVDIVCGVSHG